MWQRVVLVLCGLVFLAPLAMGQQFDLLVVPGKAENLRLLLYNADGVARTLSPSANGDGSFSFHGKMSGPAYGELCARNMVRNLPLFLEPCSMSVELDVATPEKSPVKGSRMNSQYRYALEMARQDTAFLSQLLAAQPQELYLPAVLLEQLPSMETEQVRHYLSLLSGNACKGFHYKELQNRLAAVEALKEGARMASFDFVDQNGKKQNIDSLLSDTTATILLFGASWCQQCQRALNELQSSHRVVSIDIDRQPKGWNAACVQQWAIDHIPYLILIDRERKIMARDCRFWQIDRLLSDYLTY